MASKGGGKYGRFNGKKTVKSLVSDRSVRDWLIDNTEKVLKWREVT